MKTTNENKRLLKTFSILSIALMLTLAVPATPLSYGGVVECVEPPDDMVSWWPLDETSGTIAEDIFNGNDGTHVNGPTFEAGKVDGALRFDGVDQYVDAGSDSSLDITGPITIDLWVKPDVINKFQQVVSKGDFKNTAGEFTYFLLIATAAVATADGTIRFGIELGGAGDFVDSTIPISAGTFTHVAATFDPVSDAVKIYLDGVEKGSGTITGAPPSTPDALFIGALKNVGGTLNQFDGVLDEVEIFDRVLTAGEIKDIFDAGIEGKCKEALCDGKVFNIIKKDPDDDDSDTFVVNGSDVTMVRYDGDNDGEDAHDGWIIKGTGNKRLPLPDVIQGSHHDDKITPGWGDDTVCAGDGDDLVQGGWGADTLFGEAGVDTLKGGWGDDTLIGGDDADDEAQGGKGTDTCDAEIESSCEP